MGQDFISRETIELMAQQTITTQLVIVLVIVIAVGGTIAFFSLRGGIKVFGELSKAIENSNKIEERRQETQEKLAETQEKLADAVEFLTVQNVERYKRVDTIWSEVKDGLKTVSEKIDDLHEIIKNNPREHEQVYRLLTRLNNTLQQTKEQTDELEAIKDE